MASNIDPTKPTTAVAYTQDVRANFAAAKAEIEALQSSSGVTKTDRSGVIVLGGEPQQLMNANPARRGWLLQNKSGADMYFNDLGGIADSASNSAVYLPPGTYYESEPGAASIDTVSLFCSLTNAAYAAAEW